MYIYTHYVTKYIHLHPGTDFCSGGPETKSLSDILLYSREFSNFESNPIPGKRSNIRNFKHESNIRPISGRMLSSFVSLNIQVFGQSIGNRRQRRTLFANHILDRLHVLTSQN